MEELLLQLDISPELSEKEIQSTLEKMEVDLSRKISVAPDPAKRKELEKQLDLVADALIVIQDKVREQKKKEQEQKKKELEEQEKRTKAEREARDKEAAEKRKASGLQVYKEEAPVFSVDSIYDEYEKAVKGKDLETQKRLYAEVSREAEDGNGKAMNLLSLLYALENGEKHSLKSVRLLREAAELNNAAALSNLSYVYKRGIVAEKDIAKAKEYLVQASELGRVEASRRLAEYYEDGNKEYNIPKDLGKASAYYKRVLDEMDTDASDEKYRRILYKYVRCGWGVGDGTENVSGKVSGLLQPLIQNEGNYTKESNMFLGEVYVREGKYKEAVGYYLKTGSDGVKRIMEMFPDMPADENRDKLDIMLENMTADAEKYTASFRGELLDWYGERYRKGIAQTKDDIKAWKYYQRAIELDSKSAAKHRETLIESYLNDDSFEALAFFQEAAEKGVADAYRYLGDMYATGRGCGRNYEKAIEYYTFAKRGTMAAYCLKKVDEMIRLEKCKKLFEQASAAFSTDNYEMAIAKLEELADTDKYPDARFFLARLMESGHVHYKRNPEKALRYYQYAAEDGHRDAQRKMVEICRNGLLGTRIDRNKAAYWEERLKK